MNMRKYRFVATPWPYAGLHYYTDLSISANIVEPEELVFLRSSHHRCWRTSTWRPFSQYCSATRLEGEKGSRIRARQCKAVHHGPRSLRSVRRPRRSCITAVPLPPVCFILRSTSASTPTIGILREHGLLQAHALLIGGKLGSLEASWESNGIMGIMCVKGWSNGGDTRNPEHQTEQNKASMSGDEGGSASQGRVPGTWDRSQPS